MPLDRCTFLKSSSLLGGAIGLGALPSLGSALPAGAEPQAAGPALEREREVLAAWHAKKGS